VGAACECREMCQHVALNAIGGARRGGRASLTLLGETGEAVLKALADRCAHVGYKPAHHVWEEDARGDVAGAAGEGGQARPVRRIQGVVI